MVFLRDYQTQEKSRICVKQVSTIYAIFHVPFFVILQFDSNDFRDFSVKKIFYMDSLT